MYAKNNLDENISPMASPAQYSLTVVLLLRFTFFHFFTDQDSIVDIDPQTICGYNPCAVAKCILLPYATCVSDFKCRPVFFDSEERKVPQCSGE